MDRERDGRITRGRAFSLVELVLVIAIMATLAAIAAPRYAGALANYRAETAAWRVVTDLAYAHKLARTSGAAQTVQFQTASGTYTLPGAADPTGGATPYVIDLGLPPYQAALVSASFGNDAEVVFDGYGVPDSGGTVVVGSGGVTRTIVLDAKTGKAVRQ